MWFWIDLGTRALWSLLSIRHVHSLTYSLTHSLTHNRLQAKESPPLHTLHTYMHARVQTRSISICLSIASRIVHGPKESKQKSHDIKLNADANASKLRKNSAKTPLFTLPTTEREESSNLSPKLSAREVLKEILIPNIPFPSRFDFESLDLNFCS